MCMQYIVNKKQLLQLLESACCLEEKPLFDSKFEIIKAIQKQPVKPLNRAEIDKIFNKLFTKIEGSEDCFNEICNHVENAQDQILNLTPEPSDSVHKNYIEWEKEYHNKRGNE